MKRRKQISWPILVFTLSPFQTKKIGQKYKKVYFLIHKTRDNSEGLIKDSGCILFNLAERFHEFDK